MNLPVNQIDPKLAHLKQRVLEQVVAAIINFEPVETPSITTLLFKEGRLTGILETSKNNFWFVVQYSGVSFGETN